MILKTIKGQQFRLYSFDAVRFRATVKKSLIFFFSKRFFSPKAVSETQDEIS